MRLNSKSILLCNKSRVKCWIILTFQRIADEGWVDWRRNLQTMLSSSMGDAIASRGLMDAARSSGLRVSVPLSFHVKSSELVLLKANYK